VKKEVGRNSADNTRGVDSETPSQLDMEIKKNNNKKKCNTF
jgi:hypothetical protein